MSHRIIEDCIGCGACRRVCPTNAITGEPKELHAIAPHLCIDCGSCGRVCPAEAVRDSSGYAVVRRRRSEWARPAITAAACYACENCVAVCPTGALSMKDESLPLKDNYAVLSAPQKCVSCGWCVDNCQFEAIFMEVPRAND